MAKKQEHVSIDYYSYLSGMRDWNTTYKVIFSVGALLTVIAANRVMVSAATVCFMLLLSVCIGKVRLRDYLQLLAVPATFILLSGTAIAIQTGEGEGALWSLQLCGGSLFVTGESLFLAGSTALKAFGAVSALYLMTLSTPVGEILTVFRRVHVPELLLELMHLIYRYIFILSEQNHRQKEAAASRMGYRDFKTSMRTFGMELANLFLFSIQKSGVYYDAMESRGYQGACLFWEEKKPLRGRQLVPCVLYIGMVALLLCA